MKVPTFFLKWQAVHLEPRAPRIGGRLTQLPRILSRIYIATGVLLGMVALGTLGFYLIGDDRTTWSDAFYMTLITLTTVGYGEIVPIVGFWDRLFAGLVALAGFGAVTFLFTSLTIFFMESDLDYTLRRRRMERQIKKLKGHYIICGFGRVGRNVAHELITTHRPFVAIDLEESCLEAQRERFPGLLYLQGDGSDDDVLHAADIMDAVGVFAVTDDDSRNLMIVLTAKQLNPEVRVVARCHEVRNTPKLKKAGADVVVSPDFTGGMRIASSMVRPHVVSFLDEMLRSDQTYRLEEVAVPLGFQPRYLGDMDVAGCNVVLMGIRQGRDFVFNPPRDFALEPG
ncbi:MAG: potassium channel family protein [Rhodocyclaceae bacterium]|jgi:voltage-gated potassium channel|nr:potassium channel family protein [Rhodocyclaceae bacterium]